MKNSILLLFLLISVLGLSKLNAAESSPQFIKGADTLVVYKDVPGLPPSDKYTIRVRSTATNNQWVDVFTHITLNRAAELPKISPNAPGGSVSGITTQAYADHTKGWTHTYGIIEMNNGQAVEVEIAAKDSSTFKIGGKSFFKAKVHPAQKASEATMVGGKIYFTITKPAQIVIDINGQMDDYNQAINPIGHPVHAVSIFANPVIKKPTLTGNRVLAIEPGTTLATINAINPLDFDTMYFKPGVHDVGPDILLHQGKAYYLPGDAIVYGNFNNRESQLGSNITIFGYGTISGAKIPHTSYKYAYPEISVNIGHSIAVNKAVNIKIFGVTCADGAGFTAHFMFDEGTGSIKWLKTITWRANGDGIGGYVYAEDCFVRTQDDAAYAHNSKKRITFWKDANAALFHMPNIPENTKEPFIIEDCDVIYARLRYANGTNGGGFQQRGAGAPGQRNINYIIRDIRIHDKLVNMPIFNLVSYEGRDPYAPTLVGSSLKGILFQNISIAGMVNGSNQIIKGCAKSPWFGGLIFDNLTIGGTKITSENYKSYFATNEFVKYLVFGTPKDVTLNINVDTTKGYVTRSPEQATYKETSEVVLSAVGKSGYIFSNWSGDYTGKDNPTKVVVDKNMNITANFSEIDYCKELVLEVPGTGSFTIPNGVDSVFVSVWGAGGAGGGASNDSIAVQSRGGGGAGGNYAGVKVKVTAGQVVSYNLGAGGKAAPSGFADKTVEEIQNGDTSIVLLDEVTIALAMGGPGGQNIAGTFTSGKGGVAPQSGNVGDILFYGGNGASANANGTGGGGGSAGSLGNGGNAGSYIGSSFQPSTAGVAGAGGGAIGASGGNSTNVGKAGNNPGAGGSGAAVRASANKTMAAGEGANGKIVLAFHRIGSAIREVNSTNNSVTIYPNPASDKLFFNSKDKLISKIELLDLTGKIMYAANINNQNGCVDYLPMACIL